MSTINDNAPSTETVATVPGTMANEQKVPRDVIGHRLQAFAGFHLGLQLIRSYLDAGCYERAAEWTDPLQLRAEIGMELLAPACAVVGATCTVVGARVHSCWRQRAQLLAPACAVVGARECNYLDARAEALLVALGAEADAELSTLATQFAQVAGQTLAPRTSNDYARSWEPFREWWVARRLPGSIYDTPGEAVALYLLSLLNSSKEDKVGPGRVRTASAAISSYFRLAGRAPPTEHPACSIVRDLAKKQLQGRKLERDALEPADVTALARLVGGPEPPLDQLMTVTAVVVMFAGFFRFDDAAEISVHEDLLVITATGMDVFIPRSKTDQQRQGHWVPIARVGGAACPVGLTERLLTLGRYKRRPDTPDEDVGPLLRPVQWNRAGGYLSGPLTGTVAQPIHSLSYPAFCHRLNKTLQAAGITRRITAHSMRIGGNSTAADRGVPADLRKAHGRWRSDAMVQHYTRRDGEAKLSVSRSLGLASEQMSLRSAV
ncbi:hypothetical protein VOLCADRAFT_97387 [Volvox carteri f. nagariensis]|uniref:Tyr recombinase domain-containing protein n=1 Tax=Volvox carteri f. nagariensis TaxID=3068 RepID=D8UCM2_VOLCA|nr:uncharacterized protein VOLCADRAFT_97387 [Volvox carteri f. nagariensis]EFJ42576.1 hypothetical protein VOLCADRAFT_97387 [Volvox carteri f. nagariensis]|eukprot:XP_002956432.1 hypothetical protein VOLCADRAFT_97387 [Volvox carteri f. nagariensis]